MCLNKKGLKTFKNNNKIRIGYKIFKKDEKGYKNIYYDTRNYIKIGEWKENVNSYNEIIYSGGIRNPYSYKAGYHFYDTPLTNKVRPFEVMVECICENITAIGTQNYNDKAFVAQSYRLMREV